MASDNAPVNEPLWGLTLSTPTGPADHVDELVSDLLDIQDDIARAVIWIAEHWSADLPRITWAPGLGRSGDALRLRVRCTNLADLARVAALLDTEVVAQPYAAGDGRRRHDVTRRIGRVVLTAWFTDIPRSAA